VIIDMHTHVDHITQLGWDMPASTVVGLMDASGIDVSVIMSITDGPALVPDALETTADIVDASSGRLLAFARIHPWYEGADARLRQAVTQQGFRGLKLHPVSTMASPAGAETLKLVAIAAELGVGTMFHCGDDTYTTPWEIAACARAVPEATIILAHSGGYGHARDAIDVAEALGNIVLETACTPHVELLSEAVSRIGAERVVFGSDSPGCSPAIELAKVRMLGLSEAEERAILGQNAERLLRIVVEQ
jgi:predicted TIM-barrel fold metal-dependent hydrolase